ncbi:YhcN/YlaJ family sporulation lipoprotein [Pullulanibacillus sp. KACC 23026]|uniref:YhcN/YlaJ family sporulation lipoprotein n=1 Tax=Pullulanibacillus sp. KACC 23026 TaxID=3028315 RepID=UPI0023AEFADA|nr:YhcN/YlaJ family sporulation lipoprotein [Pullulanibacillus sp. KACC 23026]WEG13773.1 YhcN/YlaJ family sporulation lipoprotein [Pullulanibacillus sp. KACC 23026]
MRQVAVILGLILTVTLSGCGLSTHNNHLAVDSGRMQDPTTDVTYSGPSPVIQTHEAEDLEKGAFGYIHYSRKPGSENALSSKHIPKTDYQALADIVTRLTLTLPTIYDVGTLVTDQYILIGYKTDNPNREEAAGQVRATARAAVPTYYKIYISDAHNAAADIARYKDYTASSSNSHRLLAAINN